MTRVIVLLCGVLAVAAVALVRRWDDWFGEADRHRQGSSQTAKPVPLPPVDKNLVQAIEIDDGKEKIRIARSGEKWVLPDSFEHPAMEDKMKQVFDGLVDLDKAEYVGSSPSRHSKYDLDEGGKAKHLKLEGAGGQVIADLVVGKQDIGQGRTAANARTFIREKGKNDVWLHGGRLTNQLYTMKRVWLDSRLLPQDYQEINKLVEKAVKLTIEYDDVELGALPVPGMPATERSGERKRLVLECRQVPVEKPPEAAVGPEAPTPPNQEKKDNERKWFFLEPEAAKSVDCYLPMVDGVVRQFLGGRFEEVLGKEAPADSGLDKAVVDVTIAFEDGSTRNLKIGNLVPVPEGATPTPGSSSRYGRMEGSAWIVSIQEYVAKGFQKKTEELKVPDAAPGAPPGRPGHPGVPGATQEITLPKEGDKEKPPEKKEGEKKEGDK